MVRSAGDGHVEAEIEGPHTVRESADRDDVDARLGDRTHGVEAHSPGRLDDRTPRHDRETLPQLVGREVVEHDRVDTRCDDLLDLVEAIDLDLKVHGVTDPGSRPADGLA